MRFLVSSGQVKEIVEAESHDEARDKAFEKNRGKWLGEVTGVRQENLKKKTGWDSARYFYNHSRFA